MDAVNGNCSVCLGQSGTVRLFWGRGFDTYSICMLSVDKNILCECIGFTTPGPNPRTVCNIPDHSL